jgi:hypothetical protein
VTAYKASKDYKKLADSTKKNWSAWEEETVEKIIRRYVGRQAATKALIAQLNEARKGT